MSSRIASTRLLVSHLHVFSYHIYTSSRITSTHLLVLHLHVFEYEKRNVAPAAFKKRGGIQIFLRQFVPWTFVAPWFDSQNTRAHTRKCTRACLRAHTRVDQHFDVIFWSCTPLAVFSQVESAHHSDMSHHHPATLRVQCSRRSPAQTHLLMYTTAFPLKKWTDH